MFHFFSPRMFPLILRSQFFILKFLILIHQADVKLMTDLLVALSNRPKYAKVEFPCLFKPVGAHPVYLCGSENKQQLFSLGGVS